VISASRRASFVELDCLATAELGPSLYRPGAIADLSGVKIMTTGPVRTSLTTKGLVYGQSHSEMAFTVPLFDGFI